MATSGAGPPKKSRRNRYFSRVPDPTVRFVTISTPSTSTAWTSNAPPPPTTLAQILSASLAEGPPRTTTSPTTSATTSGMTSGFEGFLNSKVPKKKRQENNNKETQDNRPVRFVTTSVPVPPSDSELIDFLNGSDSQPLRADSPQTILEALCGISNGEFVAEETAFKSTNEQLMSMMAMIGDDVTVKKEEAVEVKKEVEEEEPKANISTSAAGPPTKATKKKPGRHRYFSKTPDFPKFHAPPTPSEGVPAHLLFQTDDEEEQNEEVDVKPDLSQIDTSQALDDFSALFAVKEEPVDEEDGVKCLGEVPGTSANWNVGQQSYVTSNETEVLFRNMPADSSSGLFRRTCMKCQRTMTYDRRTEWAMLSDHALHHIPFKTTFHCLSCEFQATVRTKLHSHMRMNHNAQWTRGCQGDADPVSHPCSDSEQDTARILDVIFQCFPGVQPRSLALPEVVEGPREVKHYLITFEEVEIMNPPVIPAFINGRRRPGVVHAARKTCNSCLADIDGADLWQEQMKHALSVHADFGSQCSVCHQKIKCPNKFVKHSVDKHDSKAELLTRPLDRLTYRERQKIEDMARDLFNPLPSLSKDAFKNIQNGLLPVKVAANRVICKRCKVYVDNSDDTKKGEHALLHTEFSGMTCSLCVYKVTNLNAFLFHNVREHESAASLNHRSLTDLSTEEATKVAFLIHKLFDPTPTTKSSKKNAVEDVDELPKEPVVNSSKLRQNPITERRLPRIAAQKLIPAAIRRESALVDDGEITVPVGRVGAPPPAKRPRILRQAKKRTRYFDFDDQE